MDKQREANIYLADQRGLRLSDQHRSWYTFNYGEYQVPHREAPGALRVFNEETLAGGERMAYECQRTGIVLLLPLVGAIRVQAAGIFHELEAGAVLELAFNQGEVYQVNNPSQDLICYLQIELAYPATTTDPQRYTIDLVQHHNTLQAVLPPTEPVPLLVGQFDGRVEVEYRLQQAAASVFVFVIDGVFEVQNRLLHARDSLYLSGEYAVEFEALANDAILLMLEVG